MGRTFVSLVILVLLAAQAAASFRAVPALTSRPSWWLWPFLDYPMYQRAHYPGETVGPEQVAAVFADGSQAPVAPKHLGLNFWQFHYGVVGRIRGGDARGLRLFAAVLEARHGRRPVSLRAWSGDVYLTADGYEKAPARMLAELPLPDGEGDR